MPVQFRSLSKGHQKWCPFFVPNFSKGQALFHAKKGTTPLVGKWSLDVSGRVLNFKDAAPLRSIGDIEIGVPYKYMEYESNVDIIAILSG